MRSDLSEKCPWCGSLISHEQFSAIQERVRGEEQAKAAETEAALRLELEEKHRSEIESACTAHKELEARLNASHAESERRHQQELTDLKVATLQNSREAERRAAEELEQKLTAVREEAEEMFQRELAEKLSVASAEAEQRRDEKIEELRAELEASRAERQARENLEEERKAKHEDALAAMQAALEESRENQRRAVEELQQKQRAANLEAEEKRLAEVAELQEALERSHEAEQRANDTLEQKLKAARLEADEAREREIAETRASLEKERNEALVKKDADHNRQIERITTQVLELERKLERKNANEFGDGAEIDLYEELREQFPSDAIERVPKGQEGADIIHDVKHNGEICGRIIIDSKNRRQWRDSFVAKLRADRVSAKADHAILSTTVFPSGKKQLHIEDDVVLVLPTGTLHIVALLRRSIISLHVRGLSAADRAGKMQRLYQLITSETYAKHLTEATQLTHDILDLEVEEQKAHSNVWKRRGTLAKRLEGVLREVETEVAGIIETPGEVPGRDVFGNAPASMAVPAA